MLHSVPTPADRAVSRANATAVAEILGGRVKRRSGIRLGEPDAPYEIRNNFGDFWFGAAFSDQAYLVTANHKKPFQRPAPFVVSLVRPDRVIAASIPLENLSKELRVSVSVSDVSTAHEARTALLASDIRRVLKRIDWAMTVSMLVSDVQLRALASFSTPATCAQQISAMRELIDRVARRYS
jgi:hypothetical protein